MKKQVLLAPLCFLGILASNAQLYMTSHTASFTGVSNDGIAVGSTDQNTPYFLWNPFTGESTPIGGISAGNGLGGTARISDDGKYVIGLNQYNKVALTTAWAKALYPDYSDYNITGFLRAGKQICFATAVTPEGKSTVLESGGQCNNWRSNDSGNVFEDAVITSGAYASVYCFFIGCEDGRFFASSGNSAWAESDIRPEGVTTEIKAYTAMDFSKMGTSDMYFDGCVGYEGTDGSYGVYYTNDGTRRYAEFFESEGVAGVPSCIHYVADPLVADYRRFYLTTADGKIQLSADKGASWSTLFDAGMPLHKIAFANPDRGVAISDEVVFVTEDAGETWTKVTIFPEEINPYAATSPRRWNDVIYDGKRIILAGNQGMLYISDDNGRTFIRQTDIIGEAAQLDLLALDYSADWQLLSIGSEQGTFLTKKEAGAIDDACAVGRYDVEAGEWTPYDNLGTFQVALYPTDGAVYGISDNGEYAVGIIYSEVSDEDHRIMGYACIWDSEGKATRLPNMFDYVKERPCNARANAVSNDGSVVVGWQDCQGPWMASVWRRRDDGSYKQEILFNDPEISIEDFDFNDFDAITANTLSHCNAISPNGKWIGGNGSSYANSPRQMAWIWSEENGFTDMPTGGSVMEISDDGKTVMGYGYLGFGGWLWTEEDGYRDLNAVARELCPDFDSIADGFYISGAYAMSANGRYICGYMMRGIDEQRAYVLDLRPEVDSVDEISEKLSVKVYPNPVVDELHVDLPFGNEAEITVINMHGAVCSRATIAGSSNTIDVSGLAPGIYMVNVKAGNTSDTFRVIVR